MKRRLGGTLAFSAVLAAICAAAQIGSPARAADLFALTIAIEGTGSGAVECEVNGGSAGPCASQYAEGTELVLVPSPGPDSEFVEFTGDCGLSDCELTMTEAKSVTATFDLVPVAEFPLTLKTSGTGSGTVNCQVGAGPAEACKATYPESTELSVLPIADPGSEFIRFTGDCEEETCDLTMEEAHSVTVVFDLEPTTPEYAFTLKIAGTGTGSVLCEAQEGPEPCQAKYPEGTELLLHPSAGSGSEFAGFSNACSGFSCEVVMEGARKVTATFNLIPPGFEYPLTVERLGTGSGTVTSSPAGIDCGPDCSESFLEGTKVTLTATPAPGSAFDHWTGGGCTGSGTCTTTMSTSRTAKAVFVAVGQRTLTISRTGTGRGTVTSSPAGIDCGQACEVGFGVGTKVTLTATAAAGSRFAGFSGACTGTGSCRVTMDQAREVTAAFEKVPNGVVRAAATAKVKAGKAVLRISCAGEGACKGRLKLLARIGPGGKRMTIGAASFSVAADDSRTLRIGLARKAKQMLSRREAGLTARVSGNGVEGRRVRLKQA
jgi:hypothetical protein